MSLFKSTRSVRLDKCTKFQITASRALSAALFIRGQPLSVVGNCVTEGRKKRLNSPYRRHDSSPTLVRHASQNFRPEEHAFGDECEKLHCFSAAFARVIRSARETGRMSKPKVVVGLPVYNGQKYLAAAVDSHLSQTFGDFDLVISDNGSTDATPDICADYVRKDKRVKFLRSDVNRGILWNHRRVLDEAENATHYFRWAGADDILEPGLLQAMVDVLDTRAEVVAVMPDTKNIDDRSEAIGTMARCLDFQSQDVFQRAHDVLVAHYQHVIAYGLLRMSTLRLMRTRPNYFGWDPVFAWELALRGQVVQAAGPALLRRFHAGSISRVKTLKELRRWVEPHSKAGMSFPTGTGRTNVRVCCWPVRCPCAIGCASASFCCATRVGNERTCFVMSHKRRGARSGCPTSTHSIEELRWSSHRAPPDACFTVVIASRCNDARSDLLKRACQSVRAMAGDLDYSILIVANGTSVSSYVLDWLATQSKIRMSSD